MYVPLVWSGLYGGWKFHKLVAGHGGTPETPHKENNCKRKLLTSGLLGHLTIDKNSRIDILLRYSLKIQYEVYNIVGRVGQTVSQI